MRERILAVGCGGLALFSAFAFLALTAVGAWTGEPLAEAGVGWTLAGAATIFACCAFGVAIRRTVEDEDLFEGHRGLAVGLTIVVVLAVVAFSIAMYLQPDFWRGALDGRAG